MHGPVRLAALLYSFFTPGACSRSRAFTPMLRTIHPRGLRRNRLLPDGENSMSVMDSISLLMGVGLFIYLLVALLRADQSQE